MLCILVKSNITFPPFYLLFCYSAPTTHFPLPSTTLPQCSSPCLPFPTTLPLSKPFLSTAYISCCPEDLFESLLKQTNLLFLQHLHCLLEFYYWQVPTGHLDCSGTFHEISAAQPLETCRQPSVANSELLFTFFLYVQYQLWLNSISSYLDLGKKLARLLLMSKMWTCIESSYLFITQLPFPHCLLFLIPLFFPSLTPPHSRPSHPNSVMLFCLWRYCSSLCL